jgi:hypothetical protein
MGILALLIAASLGLCLYKAKSMWNYPYILSIYIGVIVFFVFYGIMFIEEIEFTFEMNIAFWVIAGIWALVTLCLPSERKKDEEVNITSKGT